jgi:hypothetical protein
MMAHFLSRTKSTQQTSSLVGNTAGLLLLLLLPISFSVAILR